MPLHLKSVVAHIQCYRSVGSRQSVRHLCSAPTNVPGETGFEWFVRRSVTMGSGYFIGYLVMGRSNAQARERLQEINDISDEDHARREKLVSKLMASAQKNS